MSTKAIQGKLWNVDPDSWSQHFEPWFLPMYRKALDQLQLNNQHMLLDAGCGAGLFCYLANRTGAQVIGIDASPGLLKVAKRRNPNINFLEEDLEALPFQDNSFHAVTGFNSFQFAGNFENALLQAKRVLRPGGRLVIGVWDKEELSDFSKVTKAIGSLLPPPPPGTPGPFAMSEEGRMEGVMDRIGMRLVYKASVPCPFMFVRAEDAMKGMISIGPAAAAISQRDRKTVEEAIANALAPFRLTEELHFMMNHFLLFIAEK